MKKKYYKKNNKKKNDGKYLRQSKSKDFLKKVKENTMVEYLTQLRILNPAAQLSTSLSKPKRKGAFVRLAHAREEFTAPVITKGKSVGKT